MIDIETARGWYPQSDPVHGFDHVLRVYRMAERFGQAEGADLEIVRAAALLHDVEESATHLGDEGRRNHHLASAEFARGVLQSEGWTEERIEAVLHCIRAHRYRDQREKPQTIEAMVLFDADKLDVLGAIGVVRTVAYDVVVGAPVYTEPSEHFIHTGEKEPGEAHSSYHEYLFKLRKIKGMLFTPMARRIAEERDRYLSEFFQRLGAEMRGEM